MSAVVRRSIINIPSNTEGMTDDPLGLWFIEIAKSKIRLSHTLLIKSFF